MENLFGTVATFEPKDLLASNFLTDAVAVSLEPGNGVIPAGAVLYRKSGVLYAPAAAANVIVTNNLVVLAAETDSGTGTVAQAVKAYRRAKFLAGKVTVKNGTAYEAISAAQEVVLRMQGLELSPFDNQNANVVVADNTTSD